MNNLKQSRSRIPVLSALILLLFVVTLNAQTAKLHLVATNDCGVNRQTFYYHFHDIYDLIDW